MSVEKFIKKNSKLIGDKVFIAPEIPEKKLNNAIASIAPDVDPDYVVAIVDTTLFGSAKEGCVLLGDSVYIRGTLEKPRTFKFEDIKEAKYTVSTITKDNGKVEEKKEVTLVLEGEKEENITGSLFGIKKQEFAQFINDIIRESGEEKKFVSTAQSVPLSSMNEEIKVAYLKLVCNFAYADDDEIDAKEYAEIMSLVARIELEAKERMVIRSYMTDKAEIEGEEALLGYLKENVPDGSFDILKKSLIKDILYIDRVKNKEKNWSESSFIQKLKQMLEVENEQVELILAAIKNDEDILTQRKSDSEIKSAMKDLAAKAGAVGVPMAAIYFSGSVVGLGATGITSGLAALGMGGLLGFSGMVTGIGVALLIGVGAYKGIKKVTGISEVENNKQRELMLQAIIKNSQKTLNFVIEDVNEISKQLVEEIQKAKGQEIKIHKLSKILSKLNKSMETTTSKINQAEVEAVKSQLPMKLDLIRLQELTQEATREKLRAYVLTCYEELEQENEDGAVTKAVMLKEDLPLAKLEQLHQILQAIGYMNVKDAALASAKGFVKNILG